MIHVWLSALSALSLLTAVGLVLVWLRGRRRLRRVEDALQAALDALHGDVRALCTTSSRAGDQLLDLERRTRRLMEQQEQLEMKSPVTGSYRHAIALARRGADTEALVQTCGLSRGEAELVELLHRSGDHSVETQDMKVN